MSTLTELSLTNIMELEERDLSLCPNPLLMNCLCVQEVVGSSGVMSTMTELSLSRTNIMELEDRDLSLCPNLISLNLRN
jgi:hypothetical protein